MLWSSTVRKNFQSKRRGTLCINTSCCFATSKGSNNNKNSTCGSSNRVVPCLPHVDKIREEVKMLRIYDINLLAADLDWNYLLDERNVPQIDANVQRRMPERKKKSNSENSGSGGDIHNLHRLYNELKVCIKAEQEKKKELVAASVDGEKTPQTNNNNTNDDEEEEEEEEVDKVHSIIEQMYVEANGLPNDTHESSAIGNYDKSECVLKLGGTEEVNKIKKPTIDQIAQLYGWLREEQISLYSTQRAYVLRNELADLETALVQYTLDYLAKQGFITISVPDILHHSVIESCGFPTRGERTQVYKLDYMNEYGKYCLSGTSEMSLAGLLKNRVFDRQQLPLKFCAASRCYRAEVSGSEREGKLYRLHEFTKVEMFVITEGNKQKSVPMLEEIRSHQTELFSQLGFEFRILNMSTEELGSPAFMKYDVEAWMPANEFYGEISSSSNCTDYQARRLHIKSIDSEQEGKNAYFVHTLNGTACAIPRMLTCIIESNWDMENQFVRIPEKLRPYMNDRSTLRVPKSFRTVEPLRHFK